MTHPTNMTNAELREWHRHVRVATRAGEHWDDATRRADRFIEMGRDRQGVPVSWRDPEGTTAVENESVFFPHDPGSEHRISKSLQALANTICGELPERYEVQLSMELDSAWVTLIRPDGTEEDIEPHDEPLALQIARASKAARDEVWNNLQIEQPAPYDPGPLVPDDPSLDTRLLKNGGDM